MSTIGHNAINGDSAARLRNIVERWERLEDDIKAFREDQKELIKEAASAGFDKKALRALLADRKKDSAAVEELANLVEIYKRALGEYANTPLGAAAMEGVRG